ncbi:hypothetical protein F5B19DRAFT_357701 [Rostrohypoxylon terebratum]|nr:hypothetical protein F5B19DRAFT_357701 [Rostrohypoxylon terebratum]
MYNFLSLALAFSSLVAASPIGDVSAFQPIDERDIDLLPRYGPHTRGLMVRRDANKTFELDFDASGRTLFSGSWPITTGTNVALDLTCVECRTFGELTASMDFPDNIGEIVKDLKDMNPFNDASLTIGFKGVGALVDLSVSTKGTGHFTIPLFKSETPLGISGPEFSAGITFNIDLVVGVTAEIETKGGFEVTIPDGSSFTINLDEKVGNKGVFNGAHATLLPLSVNAPATVTVALRVAVQGGIQLPKIPLVKTKAIAGAYINIPEVTLGEEYSNPPKKGSNCVLPASAEVNINAGAYVDVGVSVADISIGDYDPTVSTTFFEAATSTCFVTTSTKTSAKTTAKITGTAKIAALQAQKTTAAGCSKPVTSILKTTSTYTATSCAADVINCPSSLGQVIVVTDPITKTITSCPGAKTTAPSVVTSGGAPLSLSKLNTPKANSLSIPKSVKKPSTSLIKGSPWAPATTATATTKAKVSSVTKGAKEKETTANTLTTSTRTPCSKVTPSASSSSAAVSAAA